MNKNFFKIEHKIKLSYILDYLGVSHTEFLSCNLFNKDLLEKTYIEDFVSFKNLKKINYLF